MVGAMHVLWAGMMWIITGRDGVMIGIECDRAEAPRRGAKVGGLTPVGVLFASS